MSKENKATVFSGIGAIMMGAYISIEFITTICRGK